MRIWLILAILFLSLSVGSSFVGATEGISIVDRTGDGIWTGNTWEVGAYPGEVKSTTIKLYNPTDSRLNVEVRIKPKSLDKKNLIFELDKKNFKISKKSYMEVTLIVRVSKDAKPGTYLTGIEIKVAGKSK